jgi:hypothetical protein
MPSPLHVHPLSRRDSEDLDFAADGGSRKVEGAEDEPKFDINPGELTFEEGTLVKPLSCRSSRNLTALVPPDTAGGIGRHLGIFDCTMIMYGFFLFYTIISPRN